MRVPLTVADFIDRAGLLGDAIALVDEPGRPGSLGRVSAAELAARARGMAVALDRMGVGAGERVAIVSPNCGRMLISFFGVSAYGRVLVPINFRLTAGEVDYIVRHSGAKVLLVDPDLDEPLAGVEAEHRIVLDGVADAGLFDPTDEEPRRPEPDEDRVATINYTSGTTARPKGVALTHRTLWVHSMVLGVHLSVSARDVYLHTLPMFHANGWGLPYVATGIGARHVVLRRVDGAEILRRVEAEGVTLMCGAPAVVSAVLAAADQWRAEGREPPGRGRVRVVVGGAAAPSKQIERVESELGWEFIHAYGLTETAPAITMNRVPPAWDAIDPAERARRETKQGQPMINVRLRTTEHGELLVRSNNVFEGYWDDPEATARALEDGWLHTGDAGRLEDGDMLVLTDRLKDVIVTGGENVSSIEVEDCLLTHPDIAEAAVIGVPHPRWGETVKALVVLRAGATADEAAIIAHARERLAHFKCPTSVEIRDSLPRTATGKFQKYLLREPYWEGTGRRIAGG